MTTAELIKNIVDVKHKVESNKKTIENLQKYNEAYDIKLHDLGKALRELEVGTSFMYKGKLYYLNPFDRLTEIEFTHVEEESAWKV